MPEFAMRKRFLVLVVIVILAIPLAWLLRDFVREVFLVELGRVIWAARILFESLPQVVVWGVLVAALLGLAAQTFRPRSRPQPDEARGSLIPPGRVQVLSRWIDRSAQSEYFRQSLAHHLAGLAWEVMAHHEHTSPDRLRERLQAGELDLPPLVGETLQSGQSPVAPPSAGFFSRLWRRLAIGRPGPEHDAGFDPALEPLIEFLEAQLEIYDHPVEEPWEDAASRGQGGAGLGRHGRYSTLEG